jgi:uncharacterized protein (DUF2267 family)/CBS-domain-containing membrane protein
MVVLNRQSMAYQAARAMADNHIGAVLVAGPSGIAGILTDRDLALAVLGGDRDPKTTPLDDVMSEEVVTCDIGAGIDEIVRLMRDNGIRRVPLTEAGRPVGLVTFDDLVVDGAVGPEALRDIVTAQLEVEAPQKPAGALHPKAAATAGGRARALMRAKARAEATYSRMVGAVAAAAGLDRDRSERALLLALCMLCRRLTPQQAQHLIAQLPSLIQSPLGDCLDGPDRGVTAQAMEEEMARSIGVARDHAGAILRAVFAVVSASVSPGQVAEVRGQLPEEMKNLFPEVA